MILILSILFVGAFFYDCYPKLREKRKKEFWTGTAILALGCTMALLSNAEQSWANPITLLSKFLQSFIPINPM